MAELKLVSPLLTNMEVESCVSTHGATSVYVVKSIKSNQTYILKHISVPESQKQVDALIFTGAAADEEEAQKYYKQVVTDYQNELETLEALSASPNIDSFRSYQIVPKEDSVGYDVYLLAEHRKTLVDYLHDNAMTQLCALNLGIDLCSALIDLRQAGLLHRDVKPANIYLSSQGHFVLGDLGIAKIDELKYCSMPEHMLSSYSAPELFDLVGTIEPTCDLYSVGLILYRIYNGNHGPFEDEKTSAKAADKRRVTGEELPAPMYADYEMAEIILKACAHLPENRYQTPEELRDALVDYMKRNQLEDTLIVPPIAGEHEPVSAYADLEEVEPVQFADTEEMTDDFKESFSPDTAMLNSIIDSVHKDMEKEDAESYTSTLEPDEEDDIPLDANAPRRKKRRAKWLPAVICAVLLLAVIGAAVYFFFIAPNTISIDSITLMDRGTDYLTVQVRSDEKDDTFFVTCSDAYGNTSRKNFRAGQSLTFTELVPGTQYTIAAEAPGNEKLTGTSSMMASTISQTQILSFTATPVSVTQCELNLIVLDGPDPGTWTVDYAAEGTPIQSATFAGHSTVIANLQSGTEYTFLLEEPEGTRLTGETSTTFSTVPTVDITEIKAALSSSAAILSWEYEGDTPDSWTVSISGSDGYADTQEVSVPTITFEDLTAGAEYEVQIATPSMLNSYLTTITPTAIKLKTMTAEFNEETLSIDLNWECEVDPAEDVWKAVCKMDASGDNWTAENIEGESYSFGEDIVFVPGQNYTITLSLQSGDPLDGNNTLTVAVPEAEKFTGYGLNGTYLGLYLKPEGDDWTSVSLSTAQTKFKPDEGLAFALQSIDEQDSSDDEFEIMLAIYDSDGNLMDYSTETFIWDDMWQKDLLVYAYPRIPGSFLRPGTYRLDILFNRQLVTSKEFEMVP